MPSLVEISTDSGQLRDLEATLFGIKNGVTRVLVVALNRTATTGRSRIVKQLAADINLRPGSASNPQPGTISSFVRIKKANWDTVKSSISLTREGIPLFKFDPNPNAPGPTDVAGVSVLAKKAKGRELLKRTFISRLLTTHVGVFERVRGSTKRAAKSGRYAGRVFLRGPRKGQPILRQPIVERFGPTPLGVFEGAPGVAEGVYAELGEVLEKNVNSQTDRLLNPRAGDLSPGDGKASSEDAS